MRLANGCRSQHDSTMPTPDCTLTVRRMSIAVLTLVIACGAPAADTPTSAWDADAKSELLDRVAADQSAREQLIAGMRGGITPDSAALSKLAAVDSANTEWLASMVEQHGWPDSAVVGADGASAAFLLVQHADADTAFQASVLRALEAAHRRGVAEGQHVALLSDRLAKARGEPQLYGTQADLQNGRFVLWTVRDSAGLHARRETMGLPPLDVYLRMMDSMYLGTPTP